MAVKVSEYQDFVDEVWVNNDTDPRIPMAVAALGLVGEAGEVSEHYKKYLRGTHKLNVEEIKIELGDVLYYVTKLANMHNWTLKELMEANMTKLTQRYLKAS